MTRIQGLSPISTPNARVLILGSMPGARSLHTNEYYAHKGNAFWKIMGELVGAGWDKPYSERVGILNDKGIAVWDVIKSCARQGSSDAKIRDMEPNDLTTFFRIHTNFAKIGLNGQKAANAFKEFAHETYPSNTILFNLPSTSSQYSRLTFEAKRSAYSEFIAS